MGKGAREKPGGAQAGVASRKPSEGLGSDRLLTPRTALWPTRGVQRAVSALSLYAHWLVASS